MRVQVTRHTDYSRPGTPLTFSVGPGLHCLPHDVRDFVIRTGAGYLVTTEPGNRDGGIAALITRKRRL